ncbi:hypothetical protein EDB85DRAFT_1891771 [Lactarius pseudohatsudake]|nr:hypothetical protein EDB85DRAFT_1891771 [Lactarius pseudohatsudake]
MFFHVLTVHLPYFKIVMDDKKDIKQDKTSAKWTQANDAMLLQTLADEKTKNNWGDNNPKNVAWTACARQTSAFKPPPSHARNPTPSNFTIDPAIEEISCNMAWGRVEEDETSTQNKEPGASFFGLDRYSSSEDDMPTAMTPAPRPTKRKHIKSAELSKSTETSGPQKAHCVTAGQGISDMADSLGNMVVHMKMRKEEKTGTYKEPLTWIQKLLEDPQERAVTVLEQDAEFSNQETLEIIGYFIADHDFTRVYATFQSSHMHMGYLQQWLLKFCGE